MSTLSIQNRHVHRNCCVRRGRYSSISELQEVRRLLAEACIEIVQLQPGAVCGEVVNVQLSSSVVHSNSFSLPVRGRGSSPPKHWTCVLFEEKVPGAFNCRALEPGSVFVYRPGAEFDGTALQPFHNWNLMVDDGSLRQAVRSLFAADLPEVSDTCWTVSASPEQFAQLRRLAKGILSLAMCVPSALSDPQTRQLLDRMLVEQVARLVGKGRVDEPAPLRRSVVSYTRIVRLVEDYLASHPEEPITVADLCKLTKVSERTLRNAFGEVLGVSPNSYLKVRRLHRARALLEQVGAEKKITVTSAAMASGLFHLGHFARDYQKLFGEKPSDTLARAQRNGRLRGRTV